MKNPPPILITDLFPDLLDSLLALLNELSAGEWNRPTVCSQWSVKDIAAHLLGGQIGILSRKRDQYMFSGDPIKKWDDLVKLINSLNDIWIKAASRLSPRLLCELLKLTGEQVCQYFKTLDPYAEGDPVDWAGPDRAPVWLDLAREYTEWWHHQQQIRDAVGKPGLKEPRYFRPLLDTFIRALPHTYRDVEAGEGTLLVLTISGDSGGRWGLLRKNGRWLLYADVIEPADAEAIIDQDAAWRLFTKGLSSNEVKAGAKLIGDVALAAKALEMVSVIA